MKNQTAIVIGATGLIGFNLVKLILEDNNFSCLKVFTRRTLGINNKKLEEYLVDFDRIEEWKEKIKGDVLFSAMGTTLQKAGSKAVQYKIDYTYQYLTALAAANNGVNTFSLVSSAGANPKSSIFYSRMKGELDHAVEALPFKNIFIFRPSILDGERQESRTGERIGIVLSRFFTKIPGLTKYRPISGNVVAKAMIHVSQTAHKRKEFEIFTLEEIFSLLD